LTILMIFLEIPRIIFEVLNFEFVVSYWYSFTYIYLGSSRSAVGWSTMLEAGRSRVRFPMSSLDFSVDLILPAALWSSSRLNL
jgi:hypothetical protein